MDQQPKYKRENYKTLRRIHMGKSSGPWNQNGFLDMTQKAQATKEK